jgi:hypothetical protein
MGADITQVVTHYTIARKGDFGPVTPNSRARRR